MTKSQKELESTIRNAFFEAERLCDNLRGSEALRESLRIASTQERQHRTFGRHLGQHRSVRNRASVEVCAMMFVLRGFVTPKRSRSFDSRADFVAAYGAIAQCEAQAKHAGKMAMVRGFMRKWRKVAGALDYLDLIGGR
ncbi:MAG: hypothetical protein NW202_13365 [Nitrospira sp.]|nr:hypothetical protein [Nitrospira sp.]